MTHRLHQDIRTVHGATAFDSPMKHHNMHNSTRQCNENMNAPYNDIPAIGNAKDQDQSTSFHSNSNQGCADITLRYTQLLFDPATNTVTAAEVEETQRGNLWADASVTGGDDWPFYNGRSMTRGQLRRSSQPTIDGIIVPNSTSTSSSLSHASSYSSLSSDESEGSEDEASEVGLPWEELIHDLALDLASSKNNNNDDWAFQQSGDEGSAWMNNGDIMPFIMSEFSLVFDGEWVDEDDEPLGVALLDDTSCYSGYVSSTTVAFHQKRSCKRGPDIRWKEVAQKIADTFDRDDMERLLFLLLSSGNPCDIHSRREKTAANGYESL